MYLKTKVSAYNDGCIKAKAKNGKQTNKAKQKTKKNQFAKISDQQKSDRK